MNVKPIALICVLLVTTAVVSLADRIRWAGQTVGSINLTNVPINDANCSPNDWMEVARVKGNVHVMRYRCGTLLWPFYKSGESSLAAAYFSGNASSTN